MSLRYIHWQLVLKGVLFKQKRYRTTPNSSSCKATRECKTWITGCEDIPVLLQAAGNHVMTRRVCSRLESRRIISVPSFYFSKHSGYDIGWLNQVQGIIGSYLFETPSQS